VSPDVDRLTLPEECHSPEKIAHPKPATHRQKQCRQIGVR
jgi:hypothetical protein